jgi:hypothetical protein
MELIDFVPRQTLRRELGWQDVLLVPTGDLQLGGIGFWKTGYIEYLKDCVKTANGAPILLVTTGDMVDRNSPSNRRKIANAELYDSVRAGQITIGEQDIEEVIDLFQTYIPEADIIGFISGHHYMDFGDGTNTDSRLADHFGASYLGDCAVVHLNFKQDDHTSKTVKIWLHHGQGTASPIKKLEKIAAEWDGIDLFLMGHTPHIETKVKGRMYTTTQGNLHHRTVKLAGTGGWLRGYTLNSSDVEGNLPKGNYVEEAMMAPCPLGGIKIWLRPWKNQHGAGVKIEVVL